MPETASLETASLTRETSIGGPKGGPSSRTAAQAEATVGARFDRENRALREPLA